MYGVRDVGSVRGHFSPKVRGPTQTYRHAVGWNHLPKWSQASSSTRAVMINQERRRKVEQDRVARAVQQSQQGK